MRLIIIIATIFLYLNGYTQGIAIESEHNSSITEILRKYESKGSTLLVDHVNNNILFIGRVSENPVGIFIHSDSLLTIYQQFNNQWQATETVSFDSDYSFTAFKDINGDGFKDVVVAGFEGPAANTKNIVFLYHATEHKFIHNEYYDLPNVEYDSIGNFVRSSWYAGVIFPQEKMKYRIIGDSLVFEQGVRYIPDEYFASKTATIEYYTYKGEKEVILRRKKDKKEKLWKEFTKAFWNKDKTIQEDLKETPVNMIIIDKSEIK